MAIPPRRALLVTDAQLEYVSGNLLIEHPPVAGSLRNIGRAMDAARAAGVPIVAIQHDGFGRDKPGWQLHDVVASRQHDHHIDKAMPSVFHETDLLSWIAERGVDTLAIVGYMTQNCIASTIFEARHRGVHAEFLQDATGAVPYANRAGSATAEEIHRVMSIVFESNFAAVVSTDEWIAAVLAQAPLQRDSPMASNKRARAAVLAAL